MKLSNKILLRLSRKYYLVCIQCIACCLLMLPARSQDTTWFKEAVIYEVTPYIFVQDGKYSDIQVKLPELAALGINTLYLQPVYANYQGGQGYDITDYFSLRTDLGTESELNSLIQAAKALGMHVLFDFVANHTSIHHPYAVDCISKGPSSRYYNYYQHAPDQALYSSQYQKTTTGFIYYFWSDLVNLNYANDSVQQMIIDASKYWLTKYDLDGYRFDAAWALNARAPLFGKRLRSELKAIKPGFLMLAEDKGTDPNAFDKGFDAAYDWAKDTNWVSHWNWQYDFSPQDELTIFNHPSIPERKKLLQNVIFNDAPNGLRVRFMENNDLHRFISNHSLPVTKVAATLLMTLPGIPMIYNGQEIGFPDFPYTSGPIFLRNTPIRSKNTSLFDFYQTLITMRHDHGAFTERSIKEVQTDNDHTVAYLRENKNEKILVIVNMAPIGGTVKLDLAGVIGNESGDAAFVNLVTHEQALVLNRSIYIAPSEALVLKYDHDVTTSGSKISVSPTPADGTVDIQYVAVTNENISINVYNSSGQLMLKSERIQTVGPNKFSLSVRPLPSGMYVVSIKGKTQHLHSPLVIAR